MKASPAQTTIVLGVTQCVLWAVLMSFRTMGNISTLLLTIGILVGI